MIVKICGLMSSVDAIYANMAGPDMVGMVFSRGRRRTVTKDQAAQICSMLGSIQRVGVFVDEEPQYIADIVDSGLVDTVQLHGVDDSRFKAVRDAVSVPIIRAYIVKSKEDVQSAASSEADHIILDAGMGSGKTIDWSLLEDVGFPYILSGGLDPSNVLEAIRRLHPAGVDVSSGVETDGIKDPTKMTSFVYAARGNFEPIIEHH